MNRKFFSLVAIVMVTLFVSGCGRIWDRLLGDGSDSDDSDYGDYSGNGTKHRSGTGEAPASKVGFSYDSSVSSYYRSIIEKDLSVLSDAGLSGSSDAEVLGIPSFDNQSLRNWLSERVKIIVGEYFTKNLSVDQENFSYPAKMVALDPSIEPTVSNSVMASNVGSGAYRQGKQRGVVYSLSVNGSKVIISSPRVGIMRIGSGYLNGQTVAGSYTRDDVNSYFRISTLFHEAHHGDGHGPDVGFPHAKCPSSMRGGLAGEHACDKFTNGPYSVDRAILMKFRAVCTACTRAEKYALDLYSADAKSRVIDSQYLDPTPEYIQP